MALNVLYEELVVAVVTVTGKPKEEVVEIIVEVKGSVDEDEVVKINGRPTDGNDQACQTTRVAAGPPRSEHAVADHGFPFLLGAVSVLVGLRSCQLTRKCCHAKEGHGNGDEQMTPTVGQTCLVVPRRRRTSTSPVLPSLVVGMDSKPGYP